MVDLIGRPGRGKSTFANWLSNKTNIPVCHLDKHFFIQNWIERDYDEFLATQQRIVNNECWIIDGNSIACFADRYFAGRYGSCILTYPKIICYFRILKRFFWPNLHIEDRNARCSEQIRWQLIKYIWNFEKRIAGQIIALNRQYPHIIFQEINNDKALERYKKLLLSHHSKFI